MRFVFSEILFDDALSVVSENAQFKITSDRNVEINYAHFREKEKLNSFL